MYLCPISFSAYKYMSFKKIYISGLLSLLLSFPAYSQFTKGMNYSLETGIELSGGDHSPFWLTANKFGLSSIKNNHGYLRAGIFRPYEQDKKFSYAFGVELAGAYNFTSNFIIQQAYIDLKYRTIELSIGSRERDTEFKNQMLSSGGMTFSRNARPIPQVRIGIPEYLIIPRTKEMLAIKGYIAYGGFTDSNWQKDFAAPDTRYNKNVLYHSKSFYVKIGNEDKKPLVFEGGIETAAQFGGRCYNVPGYEPYLDMPNRFKDFLTIFAFSGSDATDGAYSNAYGNHLGSWHASFSYKFPKWKIKAYYEHFFEDHSMIIDEYAWKDYVDGNNGFWGWLVPPIIPSGYYWKDGLYGLEVTFPENRFIETLVYEYLGTREQSGPVYHDHTPEIPDQLGGRDNYYNHGIYTGWQHWGMGVGNPLLTSPIYNSDGEIIFKNNRVKAHHIGISGKPTNEIGYRVLFSHTRGWGTYSNPFLDVKKNSSMLLEATYTPGKLKGWQITGSFAFDHGKLMGNNTGGMLLIRKTGLFGK